MTTIRPIVPTDICQTTCGRDVVFYVFQYDSLGKKS